MRILPTINGYTIDYRLQEFRRGGPGAALTFVDFASEAARTLLEKVWQDPTLVLTHEVGDPDAWVCVCGNRPTEDGFFPSNATGEQVEPTAAAWPDPLYLCDRCGRIIDADLLTVVSLSGAAAAAA